MSISDRTINSNMYDSNYLSQPTRCLHQFPGVDVGQLTTSLHSKFLLQVWTQGEYSAMILASISQHSRGKIRDKNRWRGIEEEYAQ